MTTYNLESSMTDQENFNDMISRDAAGMLETLPFNKRWEDDAWLIDPDQYAEIAFEIFQIIAIAADEYEEGGVHYIIVDDMEEAKALFMSVFPQAVRDWQKENMVDHLQEEMSVDAGQGYIGIIEILPGGQKDGLDYGPVVIDIVGLEPDGNAIAYRISDDATDQDWQLGGIEDAVEEALSQRETLKWLEEELREDQWLEEMAALV